jgi:hypothetical protein
VSSLEVGEGIMAEPEKITIIEGPPPTFELVNDSWLLGLVEGPVPRRVALCRVRTLNGPALVERCYRAWRDNQPIRLEFRGQDGLAHQAPIMAARWTELPEGHLLMLWVRLEEGVDVGLEFDLDDSDDPFDEGLGDSDFDPML